MFAVIVDSWSSSDSVSESGSWFVKAGIIVSVAVSIFGGSSSLWIVFVCVIPWDWSSLIVSSLLWLSLRVLILFIVDSFLLYIVPAPGFLGGVGTWLLCSTHSLSESS